jgi:hypothetical protein
MSDPAVTIATVTKSDTTNDPAGPFRGFCMSEAGDIKIRTEKGDDVTLVSGALAAGIIHPLRIVRVFSTGTGSQTIYGIK